MSFKPLEQILNTIEQQPHWDTQKQYRRLVAVWTQTVEPRVAQHTRPIYLAHRVLWVATSNSVWAQNLSLQRLSILKKLDILLPDTVKELKFSSAHWSTQRRLDCDSVHPSTLEESKALKPSEEELSPKTAMGAFQDWTQEVQNRGEKLPQCPQCHCPTPPGELERWSVCAFCIAQRWSGL
ncbi:DUF721 domain-containing protein [Gloeocapsa sp. PCC 73106]|uniref:DUF721 domain-containing protein n=1 Tax=Gloeocapsa sp. PCC 73106 TaxID=102232 RepID=UPI0002ABF1A0|nr:DciA family protein [Gloeocapsa sp. PCC 73106]ELR96898.1 putative RNA-binding protein containing Zn ribbon [Gloeocapsa sp. PCC 73106]